MTMPFGKHKGKNINDLPKDYVIWCLENLTKIDNRLKGALVSALGKNEEVKASITIDYVKSTYYKMAMKHHPDHGGSVEAMKAINDFYQELKKYC